MHSLKTLPRDRPRLHSSCLLILTNCKYNSLSMSFIVICTWRSSLIFVKSNFSKHGSGNCHLINSLTLHSLKTLPRDRPRLCSSCLRMLTNCECISSLIHVLYCDLHLEISADLCEKLFLETRLMQLSSYQLIDAAQFEAPSSGQTQTAQ